MKEFFPEVKGKIAYEGPRTKNPLAFRYYDSERLVAGKTMREQLKFAVCYWHTLKGNGSDPFGAPVYNRPWGQETNALEAADSTMRAAFEFIQKLGVDYYCFHDRDIAPDGATLSETHSNFEKLVNRAAALQKDTGVKLLWGTAGLATHPRYTHGAASNPDPLVIAHAASQVKRTLEATVALGGTSFVFWGGREGYSSLLNTRLKQERDQLGAFYHMAVEHGKKAGFKGMYFIEPKPAEPSTHQYDFDAATSLQFLSEYDLLDHFMLNIEANHATLAKHTFEHELMMASSVGKLGSLDINRGNTILGWDTDQFPTDVPTATMAMWIILKQGGLPYGGLNFDAKVRRGSFDSMDLFYGHIGGMDAFARGLLIADRLISDGVLEKFQSERYAEFESEMGHKILNRTTSLDELEKYALSRGEAHFRSGREELLENVLNDYIYSPTIE